MPEESASSVLDAQVVLKIRDIQRRHASNQRVGIAFWGGMALFVVIGAYISDLYPSKDSPIPIVGIGVFMAGLFIAGRSLKAITDEEKALEKVANAKSALRDSLGGADKEKLREAKERLIEASDVFGSSESRRVESSFHSQYNQMIDRLQEILRDRIPSLFLPDLAESARQPFQQRADCLIQSVLTLLMNPTLEGLKQLDVDTADLEKKPLVISRRPINWRQLAESQRGRIVISIVFAFGILPIAFYVLGVLVGPTPVDFLRTNAATLFIGDIVASLTLLGVWRGRLKSQPVADAQ